MGVHCTQNGDFHGCLQQNELGLDHLAELPGYFSIKVFESQTSSIIPR